MIKYVSGDIFLSCAQTIVNPVNTVGVMGKGLALQFKNKYPKMYLSYKKYCNSGIFTIGKLILYKEGNRNILLFPTKTHWKCASKPEYIKVGLQKFVETYKEKNITSIAFPLIGCGCGGLSRQLVISLMEKYLSQVDIPVYVYINGEKYE